MEFSEKREGDVAIVKIGGRLDGNAAQPAEESFARVLANGSPHIAIDMSGLDYISSAGLRVLLVIAKKAQQTKRKVVLFGLMSNVREIFSISGFDKIFSIHANAQAAVAAIG